MTGVYVGTNYELQVREIVVAAAALPDMSHVLSTVKLEEILRDEDSRTWFWRELERQFSIVVTRAQRESLPTVGHVIHYLKQRKRMEAQSA